MKKKFIVINIFLSSIFILSFVAFVLLTKFSVLWSEIGSFASLVWSDGVKLEKAKEFHNSFYVVVTGSVFTGITTLLSGLALLVIDYKFLKHKTI